MKYSNGRSIARAMGELIAARIERPAADFLVPVPLHIGSEREYNQAELIALGASAVWGIPVKMALSWRADVARQATQGTSGDRVLPEDAMRMTAALRAGTRIYLLDDVYTTGNTLAAAARAMAAGGATVAGAAVWSQSGR
ncbi:MAG: hypothetical protein LBT08_06925 [Synergistaceae bacterium]|jgi:predicted amidophosphoribosyltransferase|nr:hypothetical protein [Synergistaceae bacterium]